MPIEKPVEVLENLFGFRQIEPEPNTDNTLVFEEVSKGIRVVLTENKQQRRIDGFCFWVPGWNIKWSSRRIWRTTRQSTNKKRFLKLFSKIFV